MATLASVADLAPTGRDGADRVAPPRRARVRTRALTALVTVAVDLGSLALVAVLADLALTSVFVLGLAAAWCALLVASGGYQDLSAGRRRSVGALRAGAALAIVCWSAQTYLDVPASPRQLMAATLALTSLGLVNRLGAEACSVRSGRVHGGTSVLVAGESDAVGRALAELRRHPAPRWNVVSACVTTPAGELELGVPVAVGVADLAGAAAAYDVDAVLLLPCRDLDPLSVRRLGWQLEASGVRLYVGTGLIDVAPSRTAVLSVGQLSLVELRKRRSASARIIKAVTERIAAGLLLLLFAPLLAAVALAVRLDTPGSVIFRQVRVGRDGREFTMYKFRTMTVDAESARPELADHNESSGAVLFKIRQDPRITGVGAVLRRYSIDELPQLANVVLGQMALVGPRPALPDEVAQYDLDPRRRLAVRPGLTGLWQVSGRSDLSWEDTVRLDLHYVDNWSLGLDARIVCRTVRAVIGHDGAY